MNRLGKPTWKLRQIDAAGLAICIVAAVPLMFARVNPLLRPKPALAGQVKQLEDLRRTASRLDSSLAAHRRTLEQMREAFAREKVQLQPAGQINRRIGLLTDLAAGTGLEVDEVLPGAVIHGRRHDTVPVVMRGCGKFPTCVAFLYKLNRRFPDTAVESFELSGDPQDAKAPAKFRVALSWYAAGNGQGADN